jgi:hypothetical protein
MTVIVECWLVDVKSAFQSTSKKKMARQHEKPKITGLKYDPMNFGAIAERGRPVRTKGTKQLMIANAEKAWRQLSSLRSVSVRNLARF